MKSIATQIFLLISCWTLYGQEDSIIIDEIDFSYGDSVIYQPTWDLTKHPYWRNHLRQYEIESIKDDITIYEAYRLIYFGNYFSIVEVIRKNDQYFVKVDSSYNSKLNRMLYRSNDTLSPNSDLQYIFKYCEANKYRRIELTEKHEVSGPIIGNWAFEFKIDNTYNCLTGVEIDTDLEKVIVKLMKIGGLSGYRIFNKESGFEYYF